MDANEQVLSLKASRSIPDVRPYLPPVAASRTTACLDGAGRYVEQIVAAGEDATGAQLCVALHGEVVLDLALGTTLGAPMESAHLHPGYCVTKPLVGLAVGHLLDDGLASLDEVLPAVTGGPTVAAVLSHSAGLHHPNAIEWRTTPPSQRRDLLAAAPLGAPASYSEVVAGLAIEALVEDRAGQPATAFIEERILGPLDLLDEVVVGGCRAVEPKLRRRTSAPIAGLPRRPTPMLSERAPFFVREIRPAFGSLVTARGICRLFAAVERVVRGEAPGGVPTPATMDALLSRRRGRVHDAVLDRDCDFAGGFMVDLHDHGFGSSLSQQALGHVAGAGHVVGFGDPSLGLAVGLYLNGATVGLGPHQEAQRSHLVDLIVEEVAP